MENYPNINHLEAMLSEAKERGINKVRIHALTDGRDVPPVSALEYVERLECFLSDLNRDGTDFLGIASGGGRTRNITMDRYDADWPMDWRLVGKHMYTVKADFFHQ